MKPQHATGPWELYQPPNWMGIAGLIRTANGFEPIAQVQFAGWPKSVALGNARLIALSPTMFTSFELIASGAVIEEKCIELAQAIIAKATGEGSP